MNNNLKELIILFIKMTLYSLLFIVFFIIFSTDNIGLSQISRTMVVTMSTFIIVGVLMLNVYGNFLIGEEKSKPIIYSMFLAVFFTDLVTYLQLMIMNTNPANNVKFKIENISLLLSTLFIQLVLITVFSYFGNFVYFKIHKPKKTTLIYDSDYISANKITNLLKSYKLQYDIGESVNPYNAEVFNKICSSDFVLLLDMDENRREELTDYCYSQNIEFSYEAGISSIVKMSGHHTVYDDKLMIDVNLSGLTIEEKIGKRLIDIIVSIVGIFITLPLLIVASIAIKIEDRGTIFFKQKRYTLAGDIFEVIKFRSMKENVENYSAKSNDERITKVGKILRATRLDELPQLINVLKGDMSIVGPRPEMLENVVEYENELPSFRYRLKVKAGITGLAQIEGKYNTLPIDKLLMDLAYIENYSIWIDLRLMLRTLIILFKKDSTEGFNETDTLNG